MNITDIDYEWLVVEVQTALIKSLLAGPHDYRPRVIFTTVLDKLQINDQDATKVINILCELSTFINEHWKYK